MQTYWAQNQEHQVDQRGQNEHQEEHPCAKNKIRIVLHSMRMCVSEREREREEGGKGTSLEQLTVVLQETQAL